LCDLWLTRAADGALAAPGDPAIPLSTLDIVRLVRAAGGSGFDVRLLAPDGARDAELVRELAGQLRRDVLVTPEHCYARKPTRRHDVLCVDRRTGQWANWILVQPPDLTTSLPGWFELAGGAVLPRTGTATIPFPHGVVLATRSTFPIRRAAAAHLSAPDEYMLTLGVALEDGDFVVGDYDGSTGLRDGAGLAAVLSMLPVYHANVAMWLAWPAGDQARERLRVNLEAFAASCGAIVWAPQTGGTAVLLDSGELAAVDSSGRPTLWWSYPPDTTRDVRLRYTTSADGRLIPTTGYARASHVARRPAGPGS
jgi:hypothetical protein